jgi:hypothetical protein
VIPLVYFQATVITEATGNESCIIQFVFFCDKTNQIVVLTTTSVVWSYGKEQTLELTQENIIHIEFLIYWCTRQRVHKTALDLQLKI